jgi:hypothetical protein
LFGVGIIVYLTYYAARQDEGRYVEVDEYGAVKVEYVRTTLLNTSVI